MGEAVRSGRAQLDPFTRAELDCVAIDPQYLPAEVRGVALQAVSPLLARAAQAVQDAGAGQALAAGGPDAAALASAARSLEQRGLIVPGAPPPQLGRNTEQIGGWSADPDGGPGLRPVTIRGDLAIITWARGQPRFVAEITEPATPARPLPVDASWRLVARLYAVSVPAAAVAEFPPGPGGSLPPCLLLHGDSVLWTIAEAAGVNQEDVLPKSNPEQVAASDAPAAEAAGEFERVRCLRVAQADGKKVLVSGLVVAHAGRRHWIVEGEAGGRATAASARQIIDRVCNATNLQATTGELIR
jgi:hypothetical protein